MKDLERDAGIAGSSLVAFAEGHRIPISLFDRPDHLVLKAASIQEFERLNKREVAPMADEMFCIQTEKPFKTSAHLTGHIALHNLGPIEWVSVEEPKREQYSKITAACAEFCIDSLDRAIDVLKKKGGIRAHITAEKDRAYVSVPIDSEGFEFRFTDTSIEDLTFERFDREEALSLELPPHNTSISFI